MSILVEQLDRLRQNKTIDSWSIVNLDPNGEIGRDDRGRNTERLTIKFPNGEILEINSFCSGSFEDTSLC